MTESTDSIKPTDPVHVRADRDGQTQYVFHPQDSDLFVRTGTQVIAGCRLGISLEVWFEELLAMRDHLQAWARHNQASVQTVIMSPRGSRTGIFIVPMSATFDFDLADRTVDLEIEIGQKFNVGVVEILQVPDSDLSRFVAPEQGHVIYDGRRSSHQPVAS